MQLKEIIAIDILYRELIYASASRELFRLDLLTKYERVTLITSGVTRSHFVSTSTSGVRDGTQRPASNSSRLRKTSQGFTSLYGLHLAHHRPSSTLILNSPFVHTSSCPNSGSGIPARKSARTFRDSRNAHVQTSYKLR